MEEPQPEDNIQNNNNDLNLKIEAKNQVLHHNTKESTVALGTGSKNNEIQSEAESGTVTTTLGFLNNEKEDKKNDPLYNLNKSLEKTEDSSTNNESQKDDKLSSISNESFYQKTKRWAGTIWSYVNVKNYFPKIEYLEYRNANGDMVKIPKKKLPLKKKKLEIDDEQHIVNKTVERDRVKMNVYAADNVPYASAFI